MTELKMIWAESVSSSNMAMQMFLQEAGERHLHIYEKSAHSEDGWDVPIKDCDVIFHLGSSDSHYAVSRAGDVLVYSYSYPQHQRHYFLAAATDYDAAEYVVKTMAARLSPLEVKEDDKTRVTFWSLSPNGPVSRPRTIKAVNWDEIRGNYPNATPDRVEDVMAMRPPFDAGRLVLWHGEPGTGKSHAIRALARRWMPWCDVHYMVDPDAFFDTAEYMMSVLLAEGGEAAYKGDADFSLDGDERWKLIIVEDADEFMRADAKQRQGQALSRLLNVTDGMIGQGLNVLLLISTNERMTNIHPAVSRQGRCLADLEFGKFEDPQAKDWLKEANVNLEYGHHVGAKTLAELYDIRRENQKRIKDRLPEFTIGHYV